MPELKTYLETELDVLHACQMLHVSGRAARLPNALCLGVGADPMRRVGAAWGKLSTRRAGEEEP